MKNLLDIIRFLSILIKNCQGVSAIEYAIMSAGVAIAVLVIFKDESGYSIYDVLYGVFSALKDRLAASIS